MKILSNRPSQRATHTYENVAIGYIDESILWLEFKSGCKRSYSKIYHKYFNELYHYGVKICSDENLAKDCIQELFTNLWFTRERLGDIKSIKFYLLKSYARSIINHLKKNKKENLLKKAFTQLQPDITFSSEEFIVAEETFLFKKEHLVNILNGLPKRRKEAIYLRFFRSMEYTEIASIMNLTEKAVINHIYKAFKVIRNNSLYKEQLTG